MADQELISLADAVREGRLSLSAFHQPTENDPHGKKPTDPGAKLDAGKIRMGLVIHGFPNALREVGRVATYGAAKYSANGWREVPDGIGRYTDAMYRHLIQEAAGDEIDCDSELLHAAMAAWNALARLELKLRSGDKP